MAEDTMGENTMNTDDSDFCSVCGNGLNTEGNCETCSKAPEDCTCVSTGGVAASAEPTEEI
jgi:hypothetical protein